MPPRRSAATAPRAGSGSAARSSGAGSGGRSIPSLPAALLSGYKRLPEIEAGLIAAADTGAGSAAGPASPPGRTAAMAAMAAVAAGAFRRLAEAAAALSAAAASGPAGPSGGAGPSSAAGSAAVAAASTDVTAVLQVLCAQLNSYQCAITERVQGLSASVESPVMPPGLAAEVAAARATVKEEFSRELAESGVLEHTARALLLVQARGSLQRCGRALLPDTDTSPRLAEQRRESWRLAGWAVIVAADYVEPEWRRRLWGLVTEPLLAVWPEGRLDLDALPPAAPPEVAAALAGGLLPQLSRFISPARADAATSLGLGSATTELFAACCEGRGSGAHGANGFTLFLAPLLAPEPPGMSGGVRKDGAEKEAAARQAAALLRDLGRALRGRGGTGQREEAGKGALHPAASAAAPKSPAQRLERMAAYASGLWGLPLGA
ncbi:hypothetical protein HYH03_015256 [Edaphochlamys debaryana]|uniref:Uncharacterized protein n=1 Tax=Edaphochlamys debaryana TaxID=47281 RepID=A0A835XUB5_9CHLO|nr:hypothetical protein HYH03_015256 [Edaphochlamys debaryana]|eukprot:KAG2486049.1 hypothetical protein HYH03_015256 [Edaphochlamys debaryana]